MGFHGTSNTGCPLPEPVLRRPSGERTKPTRLLSFVAAPVGAGRALQAALGPDGVVESNLICGDNYFVDEQEQATGRLRQLLSSERPDLVIAGPAFDAGRYGYSCANVSMLSRKLGIPAVTGMHRDNPGYTTFASHLVLARPPGPVRETCKTRSAAWRGSVSDSHAAKSWDLPPTRGLSADRRPQAHDKEQTGMGARHRHAGGALGGPAVDVRGVVTALRRRAGPPRGKGRFRGQVGPRNERRAGAQEQP